VRLILITITVVCLVLGSPGFDMDMMGHWLGHDAIMGAKFKAAFERRLEYHGLQYDVTAVIDGKFMRDGRLCEFWADREKIRREFGERSGLYK
jgi:phytoene dehydrogenase-like protein